MRQYFFIPVYCFLITNCTHTQTNDFVQKGEIALSQPRIITSSKIIDSFVTITANAHEQTSIYYTANGEEPTLNSIKYTGEIKAVNPGTYKFKAIDDNYKPSKISTVTLFKKGATIDSIYWISKNSEKYKGASHKTLIDNKKGSLNFSDNHWVGFDSIATAVLYFKKPKYIRSVSISYLDDRVSWIFPPESISLGLDNKEFYKEQFHTPTEMAPKSYGIINIEINKTVNNISMAINNLNSIPDWHDGRGKKAWLFMDEWILNED